MLRLLDLPEVVLHLILKYLDNESLKAASLTARGWPSLTVGHRCRHLTFSVWSREVTRTIGLLKRLDSLDLLKHVQCLTINDTGDRSHNGEAALQDSLDTLMPHLTGLKIVQWGTSGKSERLDDGFKLPALPPSVRLEVSSIRGMHVHKAMANWFDSERLANLHRLTIQYSRSRAPWSGLLEAALVKCERLSALSIIVGDPSSAIADYSSHNTDTGLHWSTDQARRLPALEELEFYDSGVTDETYQTWAEDGNWSHLKKLSVRDDRLLKHLIGRTPRLKALTAGASPSLRDCLRHCPVINELRIEGLSSRETRGHKESMLYDVLDLPFAQMLEILELRVPWTEAATEWLDIDLMAIASCAPKLKELTVDLYQKYCTATEESTSRWEMAVEAISRLPDLHHLEIFVRRIYMDGNSKAPVISTLDTLEQLWDCLAARGKQIRHVEVIATMADEVPLPCALPPKCKVLTFTATLSAKDWEAAEGKHTTSCPEILEAQSALQKGNLSHFGDNISYTAARKIIDDMTALAEIGFLVPKKKPRPMPVWLTPEEEQDRREGPPNWRRRAKRAAVNGMVDFFGGFRAPGTEYPGRTRAEKADARESGFGGRPGWSKSSLATRVVWRR